MRKSRTLVELAFNAAALDRVVDRADEIVSQVDEKAGITREDVELALLALEAQGVLVPDRNGGLVHWDRGKDMVNDEPLSGFAQRLNAAYRAELLERR